MTKIISCVNLKGGVGKTTLAVNFAAYCGGENLKTLLIDLDPQTNATFSCLTIDEWKTHAKTHGSVADLLGARNHTSAEGTKKEAKSVIKKDVFPNVDLIPSHLDLFTVDLDLAGVAGRERRLKKAIKPIQDQYDIIVCDCPPNLTIPTQNSLAVSTHYVVPISPDYLSTIGVGILLSRIKTLSEDLDNEPEHAGIVISRVGRYAIHREETVAAMRQIFKKDVLSTVIHDRVAVSEATAKQKSVFDWTNEQAKDEFRSASKEILKRIGITK
ncbi:ParA family protein [Corallococcus coralloides]|uniref:ParA family protein n=1 Tax=Corallococcus carmarthensis TaxID=2316728 RepID=A0A3A8KMY8_9BACT|nr:ParA family protein [Corallococcus carmarthensis]NOJ91595.1 ParA family protein [Corallococcus coralloides]RKH05611.1 ParA family protein [Corallococcus carmarthensis]